MLAFDHVAMRRRDKMVQFEQVLRTLLICKSVYPLHHASNTAFGFPEVNMHRGVPAAQRLGRPL